MISVPMAWTNEANPSWSQRSSHLEMGAREGRHSPLDGDEVAEPLMRQFVCDNVSNPSLVLVIVVPLVEEQQILPVGDHPPVLHRPRGEVRQGHHI